MDQGISKLVLGDGRLSASEVFQFIENEPFVEVSEIARKRVLEARAFLELQFEKGAVIYGVNTGFGKLARERISQADTDALQLNLIRSHASGVGEPLPRGVVKLAMLLLLNSLAKGFSGVRVELVEHLQSLLNLDFIPVVPSIGSLGASGDLAPLSAIALALIGEGEVFTRGEPGFGLSSEDGWEILPAIEALKRFGVAPLTLRAKEGLSLINSTAVTQAVLFYCLKEFVNLFSGLLIACALSHEAYGGGDSHFHSLLYEQKPHQFAGAIAEVMLKLREGSQLREKHRACEKVQDPYSYRCFANVAAPLLSAWNDLAEALIVEANSATDNPLVFAKEGKVLSGANFHAERLSMVAEFCSLATARSAMMSERRVNHLLHPGLESGLPAFLAGSSGLESGLMMLQYVDSALVAEACQLAHPVTATNIPVSGDQEDFPSYSMSSALKLRRILELFSKIVAIELIVSAKGVALQAKMNSLNRPPSETSPSLQKCLEKLLTLIDIPFADSPYTERIEKLSRELVSGALGPSTFQALCIPLESLFPWL